MGSSFLLGLGLLHRGKPDPPSRQGVVWKSTEQVPHLNWGMVMTFMPTRPNLKSKFASLSSALIKPASQVWSYTPSPVPQVAQSECLTAWDPRLWGVAGPFPWIMSSICPCGNQLLLCPFIAPTCAEPGS